MIRTRVEGDGGVSLTDVELVRGRGPSIPFLLHLSSGFAKDLAINYLNYVMVVVVVVCGVGGEGESTRLSV